MKTAKQNGWWGMLSALKTGLLLFLFALPTSALAAPDAPDATSPNTLKVAAASDLKFTLDEAIHLFEHENPGTSIHATYGSSGSFVAQLKQGAPFDLFFAADVSFIEPLVKDGEAAASDSFTYGYGRIVLWVPKTSALNLEKDGLKILLNPLVKKIAVANPIHAPYGKAAVAALQSEKIYEVVKDKLVLGENIAQASQFVESQAAQVGIIALALAKSPGMEKTGRYWIVPANLYSPLVQTGVVLKSSKQRVLANRFKNFILGSEGKAIFRKYGFLFSVK